MNDKWTERWMGMCELIASWSEDRSTKVSAVIVDDRNVLVSMGWNGFPRGIAGDIEERHERPAKYLWTEHAERNAIFNAASVGVSLKGCTMYLQWYPCADCARAIIQSGITRIVCKEPDWNHDRWGESFKMVKDMLTEVGMDVTLVCD